ncbi:MAG: hypothetical protein JWM95_3882 [Gemmatimonadetes bacterium]|nr:hypothetical protein [Gemmatimonadota bacterium]
MLLSPKHLSRLAATVGLFTRYGLRDVASEQGLLALGAEDDVELDSTELAGQQANAAGFKRRLIELGPAYVKLGQLLSTRPDLLPDVYIRELETLQDDVGPISVDIIEQIIETELGARISKLFEFFDPEPLGTASLGQVHGARLRGGRAVVVKVQRPNIREDLADDIEFFKELAHFMAAHTSVGARVDIGGVVQQLERALADELDYRIEARNSAALRRALVQYPRILVPKVIEAYSTGKVLTMERVRGVKVNQVSRLARLDHDFTPVAEELTRAYLKGITLDGFFHADPHPGNVFVIMPATLNPMTPSDVVLHEHRAVARAASTPMARLEAEAVADAAPTPADVDVRLALVDFGMTGRLSVTMRDRATRLLMALGDMRGDAVAESLIEMGEPTSEFNRNAYIQEISEMVARNVERSAAELDAGRILFDVIDLSFRLGMKLPAELALLAKTLFNLDGVTRALDPSFRPLETVRAFGTEIAMSRAKREMSPQRMYQLAMESGDLLAALPRRLDQITARLANNEMSAHVDVPQIPALIVALQKVANRIFSGLVLAGLVVASAMLLPYWRVFGLVGFILSGVIALYMVVTILASDR